MKKLISVLLAITVIIMSVSVLTLGSTAAVTTINVTSYGANGNDTADDTDAFQKAFDVAKTSSVPIKVVVPKGNYYIGTPANKTPRAAWVYSNTTVEFASGAVVYRQKASPDVYVFEAKGQNNITFNGGIFDGNVTDTTIAKGLVAFNAVNNATFSGVTFRNACGTHILVIDGAQGLNVLDCAFTNYKNFTGTATAYKQQTGSASFWSAEALHIDFIEPGVDDTFPSGRTFKNVVVSGCTFNGVPTGVGTHHVYNTLTADNIKIFDNTFTNCYYDCCNAAHFKNFEFYSNKAVNTPTLVRADNTSGKIYGNTLDNSSLTFSSDALNKVYKFNNEALVMAKGLSGVVARNVLVNGEVNTNGSTNLEIYDNDIIVRDYANSVTEGKVCGIQGMYSATVNAHDNYITNAPYRGIYVDTGKAILKDNLITKSNIGIYVSNATGSSVNGNKVLNSADRGINIFVSANTAVQNNYVNGVSGAGRAIMFQKCTGSANKISGNTVLHSDKEGIHVFGSTVNEINSNTIGYCNDAITLNQDATVSPALATSVNTMNANTFFENTRFDVYLTGADAPSTLTTLSSNKSDKNMASSSSVRLNSGCTITTNESNGQYDYAFEEMAGTIIPHTCEEPEYIPYFSSEAKTEYYDINNSIGFPRAHTYTSEVIVPSYAGPGYTLHTCTVCGKSYKDNYKAQLTVPVVTGHAVVSVTDSSFKFSWEAVDGIDGYYVWLYNKSTKAWDKIADTTETNQTVSGLNPAESYSVAVRAYKIIDNEKVLSPTYTSYKIITKLAKVTGYKTVATSANAIKFSWNAVPNAEGYRVYLKTSGSWKCVATTKDTVYLVNKLNPGVKYEVTVNAYKTVDGTTVLSNGYTAYSDVTKLANITGYKVEAVSANAVKFSWTKLSNANGYYVYLYNKTSKKWTVYATTTSNVQLIKGLNPGESYSVTVRAYKTVSSTKVLSSSFSAFNLSTNPAKVNFTVSSPAKGKATVKWTKVTGATGYIVYYKASAKASWTRIATTKNTVTYFTKTGLKSGTGYFTVRAYKTYNSRTYSSAFATKSIKVR